jgi:hypothetical protein
MKQKRTWITLVIAILLVCAAAFPYLRTVVTAQPGDAADPLVTRRYVDEKVDTLWAEIQALRADNTLLRALVEAAGVQGFPDGSPLDLQAMTAAVFADVMISFEAMYGEMLRNASAIGADGERALDFVSINPQAGQTLILENGTEAVLRSGSATVVAGPNGLLDMTAGRDVGNGQAVGRNHLLIAPRTDGRGMHFTTSSWVMVRGGFTLE